MKKISLLLALFVCIGINSLFAQNTQVTGTVTSGDDGSGIPGATIKVKGGTTGVVTDLDGKYTISVNPQATLIVSFVGLKTEEVAVNGQKVINVTLKSDVVGLDEVVVTALGMKRDRKALGYSVQDVKSDELNKGGNSNMISALQGKVAGIDIKPSSGMPGASSQIVIRGARSFTGDNSPLYVVDGMPIASTADFSTGDGVTGSDIAGRSLDIDPNEIESINILKGQAAAALYGIRASNGVVVITTKSGKGLAEGKPIISVTTSTSFEDLSRYPELQNTWAQGSGGLYTPSTSLSWGPKIVDLPYDPNYGGSVANALNGNDASKYAGKYYVKQLKQAGLDPWVKPQTYDNIKDFYNIGRTTSTSANVSQSLGKSNYSFGIGATNQSGIVPSTGLDRYSARLLAETELGKGWKTGVTANFVTSNLDKASGANDAIVATVHNAPRSYNLAGIPTHVQGDPYTQINYRSLTFNNPYWNAENNSFNEKTDRFFGNTYVEYTPQLNWSSDKKLTLKYQAGADSYTTHYQDIFEFGSTGKKGSIDNYGVTNLNINSLFTANFTSKLSNDFEFSALLGNEVVQNNSKKYEQYGQNFNFGGWKNISNANVVTASEDKYKNRTVGFFANLSLNYKSLVFLNATGRNDIVSTMPRNNRSFFYPSVSGSLVFTEFDALKSNEILSFGKLRVSYAQVGQAGTYYKDYYSKPSYGGGFWQGVPINYPVGGVSAYIPHTTIYDPTLKPQNTASYELGTDLKFFNNRISVEYTYSRQNVKDQIFAVPLSGSSGYADRMMNGGKIHTDAHEIVLGILAVSTKDWKWNVGANFSKIKNVVDELAPGVESIFLGGFESPQVRAGIGSTFPVIYGTQFAKDDKGRVLVDEDPESSTYGMPMAGEPGVIANCSPDFVLGGNTSLSWKNLTLSATLSWQKGGQMINMSNQMLNYYGVGKATEDRSTPFVYDGFKADGTKNDIQRGGAKDPDAYYTLYTESLGSIDEAAVYDLDFVKLREVTLAYKVPKFYGVDLSLSVYARNILLWAKMPNFDPESSQGNTNMGGYFERFSLPQTSSFGMGLNITF